MAADSRVHPPDAFTVAPIADVIIAGILLPGHMDGIGVDRPTQSDERTTSTPVIVLTTCAWPTELRRAETVSCDLFLAKPCLPNDLARAVRRMLRVTACINADLSSHGVATPVLKELNTT